MIPPPTRALHAYVGATVCVGAAVVAWSVYELTWNPHPVEWVMMSVLALVAGRFALKVPGIHARFSISDTFFITSALLFGPAPATVTMAIDGLVLSYGRGNTLRHFLFNGSGPPLAFWVGIQAFFWLLDTGSLYGSSLQPDRILAPLGLLAIVYFVVNSGLTAIAVGLEQRTSPLDVWRRHFAMVSLNYLAAASAAFFLVVVVEGLSLLALGAVIPSVVILHLAMRSWTGRLEDATRHVATVDRLYLSTIEALSTAIEAKDGVTSSHVHRVQHYAMGLARALGLHDADTLKAIQAAALLHDTGKLAVPERILNKPGKLTAAEFDTMKLHVNVGADILSSIDFPYPVVPIVRAHHENWDGSGYPNGLRGEDIPIGARILSVVDCYDALTSDRPYRGAMTEEAAWAIIAARRGSMYDPLVVDVFARVCRDLAPSAEPQAIATAVHRISRAAEPLLATPSAEGEAPEPLLALMKLARIVEHGPEVADVASVAWSHIRSVVPGATCGLFLTDIASDRVVERFTAGPASRVVRGLRMRIGERLTGWVAENGQPIVNSDATLDLGQGALLAKLTHCLAVPLVHDDEVIGVFTLYSAEAFRETQTESLLTIAPHLARMLAVATTHRRMPRPVLVHSRSVRATGQSDARDGRRLPSVPGADPERLHLQMKRLEVGLKHARRSGLVAVRVAKRP